VWEQDAALMREAGVNLVSLGVFAWSRLEPEPGRYDFGWLDRALDLLHGAGVAAALATPTASPPPWFSLAHPEALPVTRDGVRLSHGSRDTYCASAPAYRAACRRIATALATRYGGHPAVAMWHVHNEYGTACHCDLTAAAFRRWLRDRYGDLAALNEAWTTAFWGQSYSDWAQVQPPRATQYLSNPAQELDFRRFTSDELLAAYAEQRDALRAAAPGVPVTTNYALGDWVPVDHWRWSAEVEPVAIDHYPDDAGPGAREQTAFAADLARAWAGGRPWLLMETAPHHVQAGGRAHTGEPGRLARHALGYVARGSRGAMFFQWRASAGGAERFHSALVPHAGPDSRAFREAVALGAALRAVAEADAGAVEAAAAVLWDEASWWALRGPGLPGPVDYLAEARAAHRALWRLGLTADFARPGAPLSAYPIVLVPALYLMPDAAAAALRAYVAGGGHLLVTPLSGIADEHGRIRLGGYPGALRDLLGVRVEELHPLPPDRPVTLSGGPAGVGWAETVHLAGAQVHATYADGPAAGRPAITRHRYGDGVAWYVSTRLADGPYADLVAAAAAAAGATPALPGAPPGVEAVRRRAGQRSWLFVFNHTGEPVEVPASGVDLLTGEPTAGTLPLAPGAVAVVRELVQR
jgi:beta-galactosidase